MAFDIDMIKKVYAGFGGRIDAARKTVGKPLTLTEKILYAHLWQGDATNAYERGKSYVDFAPDRVATVCEPSGGAKGMGLLFATPEPGFLCR